MGQARPGEIYSFRILGGGYGAAQVIAAEPDGSDPWVQLLRLDVDGALPPQLSEVAVSAAESAIADQDDCLWVPAFVPWWAQRIGEARVRPRASPRGYGGWEGIAIGAQLARMKRSGHPVPAWSYDPAPVVVDLGGRPSEMRRDSHRLDTRDLLPDGSMPVKWQGLSALSCITDLEYEGADRGLLEVARQLPFLRRLSWRLPQADVIDLRDTQLLELSLLAVDGPLTVLLPATTFALVLDGRHDLMTLNVPDLSERFSLTLSGGTSRGLPKGADALYRLRVQSRQIDLAPLVALRKLADLTCRGATIDHIDVLRELKNLRSFAGYDIYGFSAEDFPVLADCPHLSAVTIHGLRAGDAKILRRRLADVDRLELTKARSDRWLADNIDNPFRDWDGDGPAFGKAAMKLWKRALQEARALDGAPSREQASAIVLALVDGLNRLDGRYGATIDTLRREQACDAILDLVRRHLCNALTREETQQLVDSRRDF
ncbi:MAG TPA: hypothetical protein VKF35_24650 [Hyphomicrobiaceae bacterium]|nr:hypothetical protein [Hyphomicrobiaceae bacterium]